MRAELVLVRQRYTAFGGAERFLAGALETLAAEGLRLRLLTRSWPRADALFAVTRLDPFYLGSLWRDRSFALAVKSYLRKAPPALTQSHERIAGCDIYRAGDGVHAVWLAERARHLGFWRRLGTRLSPYHGYVLAAEQAMFRDPALKAVICNSAMVRDEIVSHFGVSPERLHLIYNAVDGQRFHPGLAAESARTRQSLGIPEDALLCLLVGSGFERKGLAVALESLARLPAEVQFVVVGRDKKLAAWAREANRLGVAGRVHFTGPVEDTRPYYGAADLFFLPAIYDPCPNAALEAMACGLPVITSRQCGAAELVLRHDCGAVCDALEVAGFVRAVEALSDPARRQAAGQRAREAVLPLTPAAMRDKLLALYRSLLAEHAIILNLPPPGP